MDDEVLVINTNSNNNNANWNNMELENNNNAFAMQTLDTQHQHQHLEDHSIQHLNFSQLNDAYVVDDLSQLPKIDHANIVASIKAKYDAKKYYLYSGELLLAVNPRDNLSIYDKQTKDFYMKSLCKTNQEPHLYWTCAEVYRASKETRRDHTIVLNGESGSGKTETCKYAIDFLVDVSCKIPALKLKILQSLSILEAFGHAPTPSNSNSSRFSKVVELKFNPEGNLQSARLNDFMLEKSRVSQEYPNERNFLVFYYILAGLDKNMLEFLKLGNIQSHRITDLPETVTQYQLNQWKQNFADLKEKMLDFGFHEDELKVIYRVLAAIILLCDITFEKSDKNSLDYIIIKDEKVLLRVSELLSVNPVDLASSLISFTIESSNGAKVVSRSLDETIRNRDCLAQTLYSRLFGWLIKRINDSLQFSDDGQQNLYPSVHQEAFKISLLDISGFENGNQNSLEQLVINSSDEEIQNAFQRHMYDYDQEFYQREGLIYPRVFYKSNKKVVDLLLQKPIGVWNILRDESKSPYSTDSTFVSKLNEYFAHSNDFISIRDSYLNFGIQHYSGAVKYNGQDFLKKNRDFISKNVIDCLQNSADCFIEDLFSSLPSNNGSFSNIIVRPSNRSFKSFMANLSEAPHENLSKKVASQISTKIKSPKPSFIEQNSNCMSQWTQFTNSLGEIIGRLEKSKTVFIKCLKPNENTFSKEFAPNVVLDQVKSHGLVNFCRSRKLLFNNFFDYELFLSRFQKMSYAYEIQTANVNPKEACLQLLSKTNVKNFRFGYNKIFIKTEDLDLLYNEQDSIDLNNNNEPVSKLKIQIGEKNEAAVGVGANSTIAFDAETNTGKAPTRNVSFKDKVSDVAGETNKGPTPDAIGPKIEQEYWWDVARVTSRDFEIEQLQLRSRAEKFKIAFKLFAYLVFFVIVLCSSVMSKLSLFTMVNALRSEKQPAVFMARWSLLLATAVSFPYLLTFLSCIFTILFTNSRGRPSYLAMFWVLLMESSHAVGIGIFLFKVLPLVNNVNGIFLMSSVCAVPAIFKLIFSSRRSMNSFKKTIMIILDVIAIGCQLSFWFLSNIYKIHKRDSTDKSTPYSFLSLIALSTLLISLGWWQNFAEVRFSTNRLTLFIQKQINGLKKYNSKIYAIMCPIKIYIIFQLSYAFMPAPVRENFTMMSFPANFSSNIASPSSAPDVVNSLGAKYIGPLKVDLFFKDLTVYVPLFVHIFSSALCYYTARIACKVLMQGLGFSLPLAMATPISFLVLLISSIKVNYKNITMFSGIYNNFFYLEGFNPEDSVIFIAVGFAVYWLSQIWISSHIWFPKLERLAKNERIFSIPTFESIVLDQCLMLNRRRIDKITPEADFNESLDISTVSLSVGSKTIYPVPTIYLCATMWHETTNEMTQLLKSIFRMDRDQHARRMAKKLLNIHDPDYYKFETHILFDDAFEDDDDCNRVPNRFVQQLISVVNIAAVFVHGVEMTVGDPIKVPTPYGGRLVWVMPGNNKIIVHMKDRDKIRHRKRWSQVMYMYYLLSYKLLGKTGSKEMTKKFPLFQNFVGFGDFVKNIPEDKKVTAQNTFILALDGDVDFKPESVLLLVDRMRKNLKVGAACGRIHPIGSGPMVWYQKFEYAVGHWLQKAAEHKLGCVLCSPGCFSLFRGSALMDDNVMRRYADKACEASHYVQFDQGEDRWLCTLLLQVGYRVDYCAASDALTYAPETFKEFFNQRRRWMPSTIANILDLLKDARHTVFVNENMSYFYIFYQGFLLASTILGPGTILLTVASSFRTVFTSLTLAESYTLAVTPAIFYLIICLQTKPDTQIFVGALMSSIYSMIMTMVLVATIAQFTNSDEISASSFFFVFLIVLFFITGCLHPQEILNLAYGILYLVTLPGGYVLLVIYSVCNLHIVSWGTREVAYIKKTKKTTPQGQAPANGGDATLQNEQTEAAAMKQAESEKKPSGNGGLIARILGEDGKKNVIQNSTNIFNTLMNNAKKTKETATHRVLFDGTVVENEMTTKNANGEDIANASTKADINQETHLGDVTNYNGNQTNQLDIPRNYLYNPFWSEMKTFGTNEVYYLNTKEITFWQGLIDKYLHPLNKDEKEEKRITRDLKELRNNSAFAFFMLNALWVVMQFQFEYVSMAFPRLQIPVGYLYNRPHQKVQILGLIFLVLFTTVLILQFVSMLFHRWGTIVEILASTTLFSKHHKYRETKLTVQEAVDLIKDMELEKKGVNPHLFDKSNNNTTNMLGDDSNEPDPDYAGGDADILPEPEPDYFDHPAVNNAGFMSNRQFGLMSPGAMNGPYGPYGGRQMDMFVPQNYLPYSHQGYNGSNYANNGYQRYGGAGPNGSPYKLRQRKISTGANGNYNSNLQFQHMNNYNGYGSNGMVGIGGSPRTNNNYLKPVQSLDVRVMRQFRALEQRDPRFKRKVREIQGMHNRTVQYGGEMSHGAGIGGGYSNV